VRVGIGYDIHRLVEGRRLILGGVEIPHAKGLLGHSDADALLHAVADALLGAAALGDIGTHFPDSDPQWKDADSKKILAAVVEMLRRKGLRPLSVDCNIIAQKPKLAPYIPAMRENIARLCGLDISRVSVKARTNEGLGEIGRGEAIACQCVALVEECPPD